MSFKHFTKLIFVFLFALPVPVACVAQLQEFTTENGLPSNGIKGMQWDAETGFLWLATEAGIVRFNGADFRSYTMENTPEIATERMQFITRNYAGAIYVCDMSGNIFQIDKSKPVLWKKAINKVNPYFDNYFLLAVSDRFFQTHVEPFIDQKFSLATDIIVTESDSSCLLLNRGRLYYFSISMPKAKLLDYNKIVFSSLFRIDDNIFVVDKEGIFYQFESQLQSLTPVFMKFPSEMAQKIITKTGKIFWENGMKKPVYIEKSNAYLLDFKDKNLSLIPIASGIPEGAYIQSVQYSPNNKTLFIGTDSKGLIVLKQASVKSRKRKNSNANARNSYYAQIELPNGNILTNEGDVIGDNESNAGELPIKDKFDFIVSWTTDSTLWYTAFAKEVGVNCLHSYNPKTKKTKIFSKVRSANVLTDFGSVIYLANSSGIGKIVADSLQYLYKYTDPSNITFQLYKLDDFQFAVATCFGLFRFDIRTNKMDTIFHKDNICVRSIWKYKDYLFFGTYGNGYYIMKEGKVKQMPLDKKKFLLYTHCVIPDDYGFCWISTNRGLLKAKLDELTNAFENNINIVYYHYFGKKDGMEMTELNGGCAPCALTLQNKTISFPTMDGLLWVNPSQANLIMPVGDIYLDEIQVDNKKISIDSFQMIRWPANTKEINFTLGFSSWCNKENIYIEYQLNDTLNWKPVNTDNDAVIRLNNLPSGKYVLRIRKLNGFGYQNFAFKEIRFTIKTAWYKNWWFYLLCILLITGIAVLYFRYRTRQYLTRQIKLEKQVDEKTKELQDKNEVLEKNNSIKTRLISIISHDIVTPLKFLTVAGKNLLEKKKLMSEDLQEETIYEITNTAQELQLLSTNILNWIKYQNENRRMTRETFNVFELVEQVNGILKSLAKQKQIQLINAVDRELNITQHVEPLKILIYNLLTNAINFTDKGTVVIKNEMEKDRLVLIVQDEGTGMTAAQINNIMSDQFIISSTNIDNKKGNGLGYLIIKDLIKMMNGSIKIKSEKGKGTIVKIYIDK